MYVLIFKVLGFFFSLDHKKYYEHSQCGLVCQSGFVQKSRNSGMHITYNVWASGCVYDLTLPTIEADQAISARLSPSHLMEEFCIPLNSWAGRQEEDEGKGEEEHGQVGKHE